MEVKETCSGRPRKRMRENNANDLSKKPSSKEAKKSKKKKRKKPGKEYDIKSPANLQPHIKYQFHDVVQLKMSDIQDLLLFLSHQQLQSSTRPKWCQISQCENIQKIVIVLVSSLGALEYKDHQESLSNCTKLFNTCIPTIADGTSESVRLPHESLLVVPLSKKRIRARMRRREKNKREKASDCNAQLCREDYLLTLDQMLDNGYPPPTDNSHVSDEVINSANYFSVQQSDKAQSGSTRAPMFAIDCEMCKTSEGRELTRISVVDESLKVVYDTLVKPCRPIVDYLTEFSGITAGMLEDVTTTLSDVQKRLLDILPPDAILVGHSLEYDLRALKMCHRRVIDTSVIYGHFRGGNFKSSLKGLVQLYLQRTIQNGNTGHCSIEDAKACMELVQKKIKKGPHFGIPVVKTEGLFENAAREGWTGSIIDSPGITKRYGSGAKKIPCCSDEEIVSHALEQIQSSDIIWVHLHQVENFFTEKESKSDEEPSHNLQEVLQNVDSQVKQIHDAMPPNSLLLVLFGCSNLSVVKRLQRDPKSQKKELREAVSNTKNGWCLLKVT